MIATLMLILIAFLALPSYAEPVKKGRVLCEGKSCNENGSIEGFFGGAVVRASDVKDRVMTGVGASKEPDSAPGKARKGRLKTTDRIRISRASAVSAVSVTNLPQYYEGIDRSDIEANEKVVFVPKSSDPGLKGLRSGDVVWAIVEQEITASPNLPTPVRAIATTGPFKGAYFVGEASLDRELKRVLFKFTKLRLKASDSVYALKAAGLSPQGSIGLEGEYVSQTGKFFIAELASAAGAGFVDATINRNQTTFGTYVQEPSLENSGKTATVTALSKTADRMAEIVRQAPEYTRIPGYQEIQVMIEQDPVKAGSL